MKSRTLDLVPGAVNDKSVMRLVTARWRLEEGADPYIGFWKDPRTGEWYAISQAVAILNDRTTPRYHFQTRR